LFFNIFQETCSAAPSPLLITFIHLQTCILLSTRNSILNVYVNRAEVMIRSSAEKTDTVHCCR